MIKINGKEMSKACHYDACIEVWNEIAEILEDGESSTQEIKKNPRSH